MLHERQPRQISFTATCQRVLAGWMALTLQNLTPAAFVTYCRQLLLRIAASRVAHRPGRLEPRLLKRRRHAYDLMQKPRTDLRNQFT